MDNKASIESNSGFSLAFFFLILSLACVNADSAQPSPSSGTNPGAVRIALEDEMDRTLASAPSSVDFSFCVEDSAGDRYSFDRGLSTPTTMYDSASTSKLVTAVIILRQVENGYLSLDDHPQDYLDTIDDWTIPTTDPLYGITLAQLLSFTSGLETDPSGVFTDMQDQIHAIAEANAGNGKIPGREFYYSSTHLQVAGLMAVKARGASNWNVLFNEFRGQTGLFPTSSYCLPPVQPNNPRLAGGMRWTGEEYLGFLGALAKGELLSQAMMDQLLADHTPSASVTIGYSPVLAAPPNGLGEEWHYGFGLWQECKGAPYSGVPGSRVSCPGAYGAYPFWDRAHGYFGIVARQGAIGTYPEGIQIERAVEDDLNLWAAAH